MKNTFRRIFWLLALTTSVTLVLYAAGSLSQPPPSGPGGFIPQTLESAPRPATWLVKFSPVFVLLYAFSLLPVVLMFAIAKFRAHPYGVVLGVSLVVISLLIEILNALPLTALLLAPPRATDVPPGILLYLLQKDAVRFLALDVAGFSLAYAGFVIFALAFLDQHPWLARLTIASTVLFVANVPFLWIQPGVAVVLMVLSILAFALIPLVLARIVVTEEPFGGAAAGP